MHQNELKFYRDILDTLNYILVFYHVKWSSGTYYFIWLKLLDKSCQIYQTRPLCIVWDISRATDVIVLRLKLCWKLDISKFPTTW
jgi:hypothetical protein